MPKENPEVADDLPMLLKAINLMLAKPADIHRETQSLFSKFSSAHEGKSKDEVRALVATKIISNYSYYAAFSGGATALAGVVPGVGTALATFGGATADAALTLKYQIEMTMALASLYGHNILLEEQKRICMIVAGLGAINEAAKEAGAAFTSSAFKKMLEQYLKGPSLVAMKEIFKKAGITFTRTAAAKAIPFGVGVVISFSANKGLTWYVGRRAQKFFAADASHVTH
ncbi:hypothetical protein BH11PSE7_BH11PSE7_00130 [soil metagenome]